MADYPFIPKVMTPDGERPLKMYRMVNGVKSPLKLYIKQPTPYIPPDPGVYNTIDRLLSKEPFYVAHRCGGGNWVEFSETAIRMVLTKFYRAIEFSVHRCASGEFVMSHDHNTLRMTGEDYNIFDTPWSVLSGLMANAGQTTDPYQEPEPLITLDTAMSLAENLVIYIDHKPTSNGPGSPTDLDNMMDLLDYMDSFPDGKDRFVWKTFRNGWPSAEVARARGYKTWGIYYGDEITQVPNYAEHFDILGLEYKDSQLYWNIALATGKPVMGHIIYNINWADTALNRGATGLMCAIPDQLGP